MRPAAPAGPSAVLGYTARRSAAEAAEAAEAACAVVQVTEGELAFLARQREVLGISYARHVAILLDVGCTAAQFDRMVEFGAAPTAPTAAAHSDGTDASGRPASLVLLPGSTRPGLLEKRQVRTPCQICTYRD